MSPTEKDTKKKNLLLKYIYGFLLHKKYIKKYNVADIKKKKITQQPSQAQVKDHKDLENNNENAYKIQQDFLKNTL